MKGWFLSKPKTLVGLDIGSSTIKVTELKPANGNGYELEALGEALGIEAITPGVIVDGVIISNPPIVDAIKNLFRSNDI